MKKFLLTLILTLGFIFPSFAQTYWYRTTAFAIKSVNVYGIWGPWSDWQKSNMDVSINTDDNIITIYSPVKQVYVILRYEGSYTDESGGIQREFTVIDQDLDKGKIRLRIEKNGNSQLYVDFANIIWVYNITIIPRTS